MIDLVLPIDDGLWLRPLARDDVADVVAAARDPEVIRFTRVPAPYRREHARQFVDAAQDEDESSLVFVVAEPAPGRPAGRLTGVVGIEPDDASGTAEVGFWTAPWGRRRGRTRRSVSCVCQYSFDRLGLARLWMMADVRNAGSNAIAHRLGFVLEGRARSAHRRRGPGGDELGRADANMWGLLPGDLRPADVQVGPTPIHGPVADGGQPSEQSSATPPRSSSDRDPWR